MENATKALLIAAAVLIAIVIIALGVGLLSSSGNVTNQAGSVANSISDSASNQVNTVKDLLHGLSATN